MSKQHPVAEAETERVNDYLQNFKTSVPSDDSLEDYLLEKAAIELQVARTNLEKSVENLKS